MHFTFGHLNLLFLINNFIWDFLVKWEYFHKMCPSNSIYGAVTVAFNFQENLFCSSGLKGMGTDDGKGNIVVRI